MNMVTQKGDLTRQHTPRHIRIPTAKLPVYLRLMLLTSALVTTVVIGWTILLSQDAQLANPFSEYEDIMPGQPRSTVRAMQFSCITVDKTYSEYCTRAPTAGDFSLVTATFSGGVVKRVTFNVRNGALVVGELPLAWGRPQVQVYGQSVNLEWPDIGIKAGGWATSRRFGYFIPITRVSITSSLI